jgi:hypothetical protein
VRRRNPNPVERTLVTAGRAAEMLGLADRRGVHYLVDEHLLELFGGWIVEGVGGRLQLMFRKVDIRAAIIQRAERLPDKVRVAKRRRDGTQLELALTMERPAKVLPWLIKPRMLKAGESLKQRLEREGRAKARLDGRPVKPARKRVRTHRVA